MTKQKTPSCQNENALERLHEVSPEDSEPKDKELSNQEGEADSQPNFQPCSEIDDGGPLSI